VKLTIKLERVSTKPILEPKKENDWEKSAVYNVGAIKDNGLVHMIYRATDKNSNGRECSDYINRFGYAVSTDGINFNRLENSILGPVEGQEQRGVEDPRVVKIDDTFYMLYTGFGGRFDGDFRICMATSKNLIDWKRHGVVLDEPNKDASLFPEKINGKYYMIHRRPPSIWICESEDLNTWDNHKVVAKPIEESGWEGKKIGLAGPPIKTEKGWVLIYHGVSTDLHYSLGIMLLDLNDPSKVLYRQAEPILTPELEWEKEGFVPNVVFSCSQVEMNDELYVYYGGADTVTGVAKVKMDDILALFD
jgi:beta-1,2-mannobiose phosphorylase / 1,2-beta-oligomannan phosphorylase